MDGGKKVLLATVALAVGGCTADDGKLNIRAIADPLSAASKRGSPMIVEARSALALGNAGTALEAFRKVLREQPDNIEALAGIAACYERMGRYDLSRVNYEAALAVAPNNPILLNSFAASLQMQGRIAEANALRAEADQVEAAEVAAAVQTAQSEIAAEIAAARPAVVASAVGPPAPTNNPPSAVSQASRPAISAVQPPQPAATAEVRVLHTEVVGNTKWTIEVPKAPPPAVIVALPPARAAVLPPPAAPRGSAPVESVQKLVAMTEPARPDAAPIAAVAGDRPAPVIRLAESNPAKPTPSRPPQTPPAEPRVSTVAITQPRLERLSMGEVALLTRAAPAWRTEVVARTEHSVTARFVPLNGALASSGPARFVPLRTVMAASRANVRLLNAARHQGLAARTRHALIDRGWRRIAIGDAGQVRARSIVLYPAGRQALGRRVAAQFGFASAINRDSDEVLVLLGRDAASLSFGRARG